MVPYRSEIVALETFLIFGNIEFWYRSLSPFIHKSALSCPLSPYQILLSSSSAFFSSSSFSSPSFLLIILFFSSSSFSSFSSPSFLFIIRFSSSSSFSQPSSSSSSSHPHPHPSHAPHFILFMLLLNLTSQKKVQRTKCCVVRTTYTKVLKQALIYAPTVVYTNFNFLGKYCFSSRTFKFPQIIMKLNDSKFRRLFCRCI